LAIATVMGALYVFFSAQSWDIVDRHMLWAIGLAMVASSTLLLFFTWRRHNWARWTVIIICGGSAFLTIPEVLVSDGLSVPQRATQFGIAVLHVLGCCYLLSKEASLWFRQFVPA